jgi:2-oxo-hept-3-ene-1,7-dioate hydratase
MLTEEERHKGAESLFRAERERKVIPQLSRTFPSIELEDAYAIQGLWAEMHVAEGARRVGHKIGLTSRAMQMASKITEPDYGVLLDTMVFNDGAQIPAARFMAPRLEVELAFVMGEDLRGPGVRVHDVMRATEFVTPALEVIDYRTEVPRAITDTIADNAASGAFDIDVRWIGATLSKNGIIEESGVSAAIMGHPAAGIAWLVNKLHAVGAALERRSRNSKRRPPSPNSPPPESASARRPASARGASRSPSSIRRRLRWRASSRPCGSVSRPCVRSAPRSQPPAILRSSASPSSIAAMLTAQ